MTLRPAIYCRVSSAEQVAGYSLDQQERACRAYVEAHGWGEPTVYVDAGRSAFTDVTAKRPQFAAMLAAAEAGEHDAIVVHKLDRFARSLITTLRELARLESARVGFVSLGESMDFTTPIGRVILSVLGAFSEYFSRNLSTEVRKGLAGRAHAGYRHSSLPYAARLVDGIGPAIEVDPAKADHLRRILELASQHSDARTAELLMAEGIPPRRAAGWHGQSVRTLVQRARWLAEQPPPWPARYLAAVGRQKRPPVRRDRAVRLLTGLMRCDHCGGHIVYGPRFGGGTGPVGLQCNRAPGPHRCLPGAPRKTHAAVYEAEAMAWVAALPGAPALIQAAERLVARDDPALEELAVIRRQRERIKAQHDAGLIADERMYAEAAALTERERALAPRTPDLLRHAAEVATLRESLPTLPPAAGNAAIRLVVAEIRICGRRCRLVPTEDCMLLLAEVGRVAVAA